MFLHVVLMAFNERANAQFDQRVREYCERARAECEGLLFYDFCRNIADRADGLSHAVIGGFRDAEAHDRYQVAPVHLEMKEYMQHYIARLTVFDGTLADLDSLVVGSIS